MRVLVVASVIVWSLFGVAPPARSEGAGPSLQNEEDDKALTAKACGAAEVNYDHDTDKKQHPTPETTPGQALVYVVRPTNYGGAIQSKVAVDGAWKGVNKGKNYFFFTLEPGEHFFCSKAENRSVMALTVEGGKTYYLQQKIRMGFNKARNKLEVIDERDGKKALEDSRLSTWKEKPKSK